MSSEWRECTLGEFVRLQRGHDLTASEQKPGSIPVIGSAGPNGTHSEAKARGPGVVIGRSGASIGKVHYCAVDYWPHNTCLYVTDFMGNNPRFAYYLLQTLNLAGFNSGSAQPSLNRNYIYTMRLRVPERSEQDSIADLLFSLDKRITLLRETNSTLEAIAQALFKSWFVDFDPVRAKQEGREPEGMNSETAALFPSEFEKTEHSFIPKGWQYSSVGEAFVLTMGQSPPGDTYNESGDGLPFYQGRTDFGFRFPTQRIFCNAPTRTAGAGDTLVSVRAPVGDVNMAIAKCCLGRGVAGVRHPEGHASFVFYSLQALRARFQSYNGEGTVFGSINKKDFQGLPLILPSKAVLACFTDIAGPIDERIRENEVQMRALIDLRESLLPRLISGQLRLRDAEEQLDEAITGT